ncbi:MAG TPA: AAA family ATPase, partial [Planctomycetaceae bacterium]|nr:AAA family ATPase [Planctomycetaceae bacterium]
MVQSGQEWIVVLSGPSGSGKTTLVRELVSRAEVKLVKSVSATTRPPRPTEIHGEDYWFMTDPEFRQKLADDEFLE